MKSGIVVSSGLHLAVLTWGLWAFASPPPLDVSYSEALPVEIVMAESFQGVQGEKEAPITEKPSPKPTTTPEKLPMPAENVGDNEADLATPPTPEKTRNQTPQTGAPKPSARPEAEPVPAETPPQKVAEATPPPEPTPPPKPEPVKEPVKPAPPKETTEKIDPLAEMIAEDKTEPTPEPEPVQPKNVPLPQVKPKAPEPVKVAEAKPETPKPEAPKKPAKNKSDKPPTKEAAAEDAPDSDVDFEAMAAAAINKQKSAGGGAKRSTQTASLGSKKTTGATLSRGETDALRDQLSGCWSIPAGIEDDGGLKVSVRFSLNGAGKLVGNPEVQSSSGNQVFDESAKRAVRKCDREGFSLPPDKAEVWAEVVVNFDPSEMF